MSIQITAALIEGYLLSDRESVSARLADVPLAAPALLQANAQLRRVEPWLWHFANVVTWVLHP